MALLMRAPVLLAAAGLGGCGGGSSRAEVPPPAEGAELIGTPAPGWDLAEWINSPPLTLAGLRGKVVLVRWFMSTECPYCSATAPALIELDRTYGGRGLVVIGMYHHKRSEPLTADAVRGWVRDFGFTFPVAIDRDWTTLKRWWLDARKRSFTSVSFLVDKQGVIRHIHPGGTMAPDSADYRAMVQMIDKLLAE
ncbi:MAG TPA: TlpA disulfide reductase family protein [Kofleriaceae bacterium]|nr:TlpA disulfide reductase family protein [Kofleriaceae bacterium]